MNKAAAKRGMTTTVAKNEVQELINAQVARSMFVSATANMGFRLAVTVIIPIVVGVKADAYLHSSPSWTLTGLFLAAGMGSLAVWNTIKDINKQTEDKQKQQKRSKKSV
ncbi:AtpZ/AtpI family protein [Candidatus Saccharibacteria bacterium]|nr:AtpZ/AtpI family protein [Candidatus Saccharibacteria bacterium]MBI3338014.1 AtpZ/AtpI family protein [Candidatus Saccharibacteria bacterium]